MTSSSFQPKSSAGEAEFMAQRRATASVRDVQNKADIVDAVPHRLGEYLTTEEMADACGIKPQSVRKRFCQTGSYFGLRPVKLPNRRLAWNADAVTKFLRGEVVQ